MKKVKRKTTTKVIVLGVKVVTNPKFTTDEQTPLPDAPRQLYFDTVKALGDAVRSALYAGIAIGRARATASGRKVVKRAKK